MKLLTKRQKQIESIRQLKKFVNDKMLPKLINDVKTTVKKAELPQDWYKKDDHLLSNFVFHNFCDEHIKKSDYSELTKKEFEQVKNNLKH